MTRDELKILVKGLKSIYSDPKYIADQFAFDMWYGLLGDLPYEVVSMATQAYMQTEKFPPTPADIRRYSYKVTSPVTEDMSEIEAWGLVRKALRNGIYGAEEEFAKLPPLIRKVIGSPANIRELAQLEYEEVENIEGSHFKRNYRAMLERQKQDSQLQDSLRTQIGQMRDSNTPVIEEKKEEYKQIESRSETREIPAEIQAELDRLINRSESA